MKAGLLHLKVLFEILRRIPMVAVHSPFCPRTASKGQAPALILQMILHELFYSPGKLVKTEVLTYSPFDWSCEAGSYNKVREHAALLAHAFPDLAGAAEKFREDLSLPCKELFLRLEPFLQKCKNNENLLFFLLEHYKYPGVQSFLSKISPQGLEKLKMSVAAKLKKRGFQPPAWLG